MRILKLAAVCFTCLTTNTAANAVEFPDGTVSFSESPRLVEATATFNSVNVPAAKYYFTIALPANADEPLGTVTIRQRNGADDVCFLVEQTFAFIDTPGRDRQAVNIQATIPEADGDIEPISVSFEPPISPGTTVTIGLRPRRNPDRPGVYLFGVTAFPAGEKPLGLYLGPGRLQFYRSNDRFSD